jgi:hypothetical protein
VPNVTCGSEAWYTGPVEAELHFDAGPADLFDTHHQPTRTQRRRASIVALAVIAVLVAGVLPACAIGCCMSQNAPPQASIHRDMPCCNHDSSIAPRIDSQVQQATFAGPLVPPSTVVAHVVTLSIPATTTLLTPLCAAGGSPPLFLTNQQFLI